MVFPWVCHVCQAAFFGIRFSNLVGSWADAANVMFHGTTQRKKKRMGRHILQIDISYLDIIYLKHNICVLHMCIPTNEFGKNRVKSSELKIAEATNIC